MLVAFINSTTRPQLQGDHSERSQMVNSRYQRGTYEYEFISVPDHLLLELETRLEDGKDIIGTATENFITPYHLAWIQSFESIVQELDPLGEIDTWSGEHSDSLIRKWHYARYGGDYSSHDIETRDLSEKYLEAKRFHAYLAVLLNIKRGKVRVVKAKNLVPIDSTKGSGDLDTSPTASPTTEANDPAVFIVHGHDEATLSKVARFLLEIGFSPVILHEQSNAGDTIIEKFERHSSTRYAVVLYTDCDVGASKAEPESMKDRARQNVVFEHGYLVSKLGRANVCALVKPGVEVPSDLSGVVYVVLDHPGAWRLQLARELRASGFLVDMNKVV